MRREVEAESKARDATLHDPHGRTVHRSSDDATHDPRRQLPIPRLDVSRLPGAARRRRTPPRCGGHPEAYGLNDNIRDITRRFADEGYATLARLREAALKADAGDLQGAAAGWDRVAGDSSADPLLRDLASLLWAQHLIDSGDPSLLEARLKAMATPDNPWRALAEEQLALLSLRQGQVDQAKTTLRRLAHDMAAPSGVRGRASALLSRLGG